MKICFDYTWPNIWQGAVTYSIGDAIAALILGEFSIYRMIGIAFVGGTFYAIEIPNYFRWIDNRVPDIGDLNNSIKRLVLMAVYFNPVWVARHLLFIYLFSGNCHQIGWGLVLMGTWSSIASLPIAIPVDYMIQNKIPYHWRHFSSGIFAGVLAIYYALTEVLFG
uniref:Uncharacterized protein n=1 Tax=Candidatus Kentrum sp. MB TaxID=2138164 RepID=A0A451BF66_9GAMM|nr:MAG: hypothetical protein BECKMB1821I_GA0114274_10837 [Candidatus Kentron sp. MB]VFK76924.1 MAG: hypothetical protein BECKMB1821H_GA0114242_10847 [Candidatus Kentron sp. MB]